MNTLFPNTPPPMVTPRERHRLTKHLHHWGVLNNYLKLQKPGAEMLRKMLTVEADTQKRPHILKRLIGKLDKAERARLYTELGLE